MSDYTKITDYSAKDALSSGDAAKRVKGSELGADFDAVAVAVATKANSASPVFTGVSSFAVGAVGAPSIYMTGYATTGWYNIGANNWGFAVSGAKVLDVSSTGLAVTGTLSATGTSSLARIDQSNGSITFSSLGNGSTSWQIGTQTALKPLDIFIGGSVRAQFSDTGLAVTGEAKTTGNLGIGAAPGATAGRSLDIEGLTLTPFVVLRQTGTTANTTTYKQDNANSRVELSSDTFPIHLRIGGTSIGVVSSTGLAVTGETFVNCSSAQGTEKFRADVASGSTEVARITCGDGGYASNMLVMNAARVANASFSFQGGYANSVVQYTILGNGNMQNVNNSYGATSDAKLKENITDATPKLADLLKVRIRNYNLKSDSSNKQIGVIAQELETIFPALVEETQDKDEAGVLLGTTTKAVKYSVFVPMLIKALQELNAKFEAYVESHP